MRGKDFLLSILKSSPVFSAVTMIAVASSWAQPENVIPAWKTPNWGFKNTVVSVKETPLHNSLIFDQKFDKVSYRPAPKVYVTLPLIPNAPEEKIVAKTKIEEIANNVSATSPFFVEKAISQSTVVSKIEKLQSNSDLLAHQAIQNVIEANKEEKALAQAPAKVVASTPTPSLTKTTSVKSPLATSSFVAPQEDKNSAKIVVIDEESLLNRNPRVVVGAKISWTGYHSGLITQSDQAGLARPPYPNVSSMRFVVEAEGYLPAIGYAVKGVVTPVVLFPEKRLAPILQSLGLVPEAGKTLVLGKVLDKKMKPVANVSIDASLQAPGRVYYSAGSFGVFHPGVKETGAQGDFLISGLRRGIQYIMPTQNLNPAGLLEASQKELAEAPENKEWPSFIGDFSGLPSVVSVAIQEGIRSDLKTQIVDSMSMEKPSSGVHVTVGGQRGLYIPDEEGFVRLNELFLRSSVDVVEVHSPGYLKSWATPVANKESFPDPIQMFSYEQLKAVFQGTGRDVNLARGVVLSQMRPEKFLRPTVAEVFSFNGKKSRGAEVFYFDEKGLNPRLTASIPSVGGFAVTNLEDGEWHILLLDAATRLPVSGQIVRVQKNTVSQIQF